MSKLIIKTNNKQNKKNKTKNTKVVAVRAQGNGAHRPSSGKSSPATAYLAQYAKTLSDPFDYGPVALGYDCYLPTTLTSAYLRRSLTVNATDGSFGLVLFPDASNMVSEANTVKSSAFNGTYLAAANLSSIVNNFAETRIVSGGIRCFALFPETNAPGVLFSGTAVDLTRNDYFTTSRDVATGWPSAHLGIGSKGATSTLRPYDNGSFEFFGLPITGYAPTTIPYMTSAYIVGTGFPIGTVIWYEAVLNMECMAKSTASSSALPVDDQPAPTMASFFPTPGELFTKVQSILSPSVVMDAGIGVAQLAAGNRIGAAASASRILSKFGAGNHFNKFVQSRGRESTIMIEEMKEDGQYVRLRRA